MTPSRPCQVAIDGREPCPNPGVKSVEFLGREVWFCDEHLISRSWQQFRDGDVHEIED